MQLQGGNYNLLGTNSSPQTSSSTQLQPATNVMNYVDPVANSAPPPDTTFDPAQAAADAKAAQDAAKAALLRDQVTGLVNTVKDIFNSRYGAVDTLAGEQTGKLNERFGNESKDITDQVTSENQKIGAAHAAGGTYDSSYRGNNVDTVTKGGQAQIRDLGTELQDNISKIAAWVASQKGGFDASKSGYDMIASHLAEETDPGRLTDLRNTLDAKIAELQGGQADYNSAGTNAQSLASIAPSSTRVVQLKTTLSQIIAGNADPGQKLGIGKQLISSANLSPEEQQQLLGAFTSDLSAKPKVDENGQPITA